MASREQAAIIAEQAAVGSADRLANIEDKLDTIISLLGSQGQARLTVPTVLAHPAATPAGASDKDGGSKELPKGRPAQAGDGVKTK